jgi:hypothetical protein
LLGDYRQMSEVESLASAGSPVPSGPRARTATLPITVYGMVDPREAAPRPIVYVGQTKDLRQRRRDHLTAWTSNTGLRRWIADLKTAGLEPEFVTFAVCESEGEADELERRQVARLKALGQAQFNRAGGGKTDRSRSKLNSSTPEDWFQLFRLISETHGILCEIIIAVGKVAPVGLSTKAQGVAHALEMLGDSLRAHLGRHRPDWAEVTDEPDRRHIAG